MNPSGPREHSSGKLRRLGRVTKRGDTYLRMLLIHGARAELRSAKVAKKRELPLDRTRAWALALAERIGHNKAAVALANKTARRLWAAEHYTTATAPLAKKRFTRSLAMGVHTRVNRLTLLYGAQSRGGACVGRSFHDYARRWCTINQRGNPFCILDRIYLSLDASATVFRCAWIIRCRILNTETLRGDWYMRRSCRGHIRCGRRIARLEDSAKAAD